MPHLYLVFDDWWWGYSIRKVDLSSSSNSDSDDSDGQMTPAGFESGDSGSRPIQQGSSAKGAVRPLPRSLFRIEAPGECPTYFASAFGPRILALHPTYWEFGMMNHFPMYDVRDRGFLFGPRPQADPADPIYIPVHDKLFALAPGSLEVLPPPPLELEQPDELMHCPWSWHKLQDPPFDRQDVASYAVHPDGRVLVSTVTRDDGTAATFAFDTKLGTWSPQGNWRLPFSSCGNFDVTLGAYVGLSGDTDSLGHLYSCNIVVSSDGQCLATTQKLSKERLFSNDPDEQHLGATLVHLDWRFCLVQCYCTRDPSQHRDPSQDRCWIRLTTFSLEYDRNGDLTTSEGHQVGYFKAPESSSRSMLMNPVAFWI